MKRCSLVVFIALLLILPRTGYSEEGHSYDGPAKERATTDDNCPTTPSEARDAIRSTALRFFLENTNPVTGLVRDTARDFGPTDSTLDQKRASIAATGFGLAVIAQASREGRIRRDFAERYCLRALEFTDEHKKDLSRNGWFLHFMNWSDGSSWGHSEYSTTDTASFLGGVLTCRETFPTREMKRLADDLYGSVNFIDMLTDGDAKPGKQTLSLSYRDQASGKHPAGYSPSQWDHYAEETLLLILGLGAPNPAYRLPPSTWRAWNRESKVIGAEAPALQGKELVGYDRALFTHQYSQVFLDLRNKRDLSGIDFFNNSQLGTEYNRMLCLADKNSPTFREGFWGLSAGDAPPNPGMPADSVRYQVNTPTRPLPRSGTVCLGCVPGSAQFSPEVIDDVASWCRGALAPKIWGKYGLVDSVNLGTSPQGWFSPLVHAITVGPEYLSASNLDSNPSVWSAFMQNADVQRGMQAAFGQ